MQVDWTKIQSQSIDRLRFPMAVAVVMLHYCQTISMQATGPIRFLCLIFQEGVCRLAVPCFFFISGFLFFNKLHEWSWSEWRRKIKGRVKSLLIPYLLWNIIALICFWGHDIFAGNSASLIQQYHNYGGIRLFWSTNGGIPIGSSAFPIDGPLWFVRDLIYYILLTPLIYLFLKWTKIFGVLGICGLFLASRRVLPEGFVFFVLGAYMQLSGKNIVKTVLPHKWWLLVVTVLLLAAVCFLLDYSDRWGRFCKFFFLICGIGVSFCLVAWNMKVNVHESNQFLARSTFFIFAAHDILILRKVACPLVNWALPSNCLWGDILSFFLAPAITVLICLCIFFLMRKVLPRTTGILTGDRHKALA